MAIAFETGIESMSIALAFELILFGPLIHLRDSYDSYPCVYLSIYFMFVCRLSITSG